MPSGRYLDLVGRDFAIKTRNGRNTQVWYFHQQSLTIKSKSNNQSWDIKSSGATKYIQVWSTNSGWWQIFTYQDEFFINWQNKKVLDVEGGKDEEGGKVIVWNRHGGKNQRWNVVYVDKAEKIKDEGLNKDFGFEVNRPFYIVSRLPFHRIAEAQGNNQITLKRWVAGRKKQQTWKFDPVAKVIRNMNWTNYVMEIPSNGGANDLKISGSISSRWW